MVKIDMDMPKSCMECRFCLKLKQKGGLALCLAKTDNNNEEYNPKHLSEWRPRSCPLMACEEKMSN